MRAILTLLVLLAVATPASAQESVIELAKTKVVNALKDPGSAQFKNVVRSRADESSEDGIVCGWVNARNSFGGYVGFKPFFVVGDAVQFRDDDSARMLSNRSFFASVWNRCFPPSGEKFGEVLVDLPKLNIDKQCAKSRKRDPSSAHLYEQCEANEASALEWLKSHPTASWIADRCRYEARNYKSYSMAKSCVVEQEADIVFRRGPRLSSAADTL